MVKRVQIVGHNATGADAFTGLDREVTVDTTVHSLRVHDGSTPGGHEIAKADASNIQAADNTQDGKMTAALVLDLETAQVDILNLIDYTRGFVSVNIAGAVDVVLSADEAGHFWIDLTGAVTADIEVIMPATAWACVFTKKTTGAGKVKVRLTSEGDGTGVQLPDNAPFILASDGTNVQIPLGFDNSTTPLTATNVVDGLIEHAADLTNPHVVTTTQIGALAVSNNLSDLGSAATARTNLGLGTAATKNTGVANGQVPLMDATGYPAADGSQITGIDVLQYRHRYGLRLANNLTDAAKDIDIYPGGAVDLDKTALMELTSKYTKQLDAAWAVGNNQGMLDTGSVTANKIYHIYLIQRSDTDVVDVLASLKGRYPTMPANYDRQRRIGMVLTDGSANIRKFFQSDSYFELQDRIFEYVGASSLYVPTLGGGAADVWHFPISMPAGHQFAVQIGLTGEQSTGDSFAIIQPGNSDEYSFNFQNGLGGVGDSDLRVTGGGVFNTASRIVSTDHFGKICIGSDNNGFPDQDFVVALIGWFDPLDNLEFQVDEQYASSVTEDTGFGTRPWTNLTNAQGAPNGTDATATGSSVSDSYYIKSASHGFNLPSTAIVKGIQAEVRTSELTPAVQHGRVRIVKGGTIGTTDRVPSVVNLDGTDVDYRFGNSEDLWGETWLYSDINASGFGMALSYHFLATSDQVGVDSMLMRVAWNKGEY